MIKILLFIVCIGTTIPNLTLSLPSENTENDRIINNINTIKSYMDTTIDPCTNFIEYACGNYNKNINENRNNMKKLDVVSEEFIRKLFKIFQQEQQQSSNSYQSKTNSKIKNFLNSCLSNNDNEGDDDGLLYNDKFLEYKNSKLNQIWPITDDEQWNKLKSTIKIPFINFEPNDDDDNNNMIYAYLTIDFNEKDLMNNNHHREYFDTELLQNAFMKMSNVTQSVSMKLIKEIHEYMNVIINNQKHFELNNNNNRTAGGQHQLILNQSNSSYYFQKMNINEFLNEYSVLNLSELYSDIFNINNKTEKIFSTSINRKYIIIIDHIKMKMYLNAFSLNPRVAYNYFLWKFYKNNDNISFKNECSIKFIQYIDEIFIDKLYKEFINIYEKQKFLNLINEFLKLTENLINQNHLHNINKYDLDLLLKSELSLLLNQTLHEADYNNENNDDYDADSKNENYYKQFLNNRSTIEYENENIFKSSASSVAITKRFHTLPPSSSTRTTMKGISVSPVSPLSHNECQTIDCLRINKKINFLKMIITQYKRPIYATLPIYYTEWWYKLIKRNQKKYFNINYLKNITDCILNKYENMEIILSNSNLLTDLLLASSISLELSYKNYLDIIEKYSNTGTDNDWNLYENLSRINLNVNKAYFINYAQTYCLENYQYKIFIINILQNTRKFSEVFNCPNGSEMNPIRRCY